MAKDDHVEAIQDALRICGCYPGKADGLMGPNTKRAIKEFQRNCGISDDGIAGPTTIAHLSEHLGEAIIRANTLKGYFAGGASSAEDDL